MRPLHANVTDNHLMTGYSSSGNRLILFSSALHRETLRFLGNKINCFPCDQSLSVK